MRADLTDTNLSDTVYMSFKVRHTGGAGGLGIGLGWKEGRVWFVDDSGAGFGLYIALQQSGAGALSLGTTSDDGNTEASSIGSFTAPPSAAGNDLKQVELVYNRLTDQVQCFYEGVLMGTLSGVSSSYRDFTRVIVNPNDAYFGVWGQVDVDDIRITDASVGN